MSRFTPQEGETVLFETGMRRTPAAALVVLTSVFVLVAASEPTPIGGWFFLAGWGALGLSAAWRTVRRRYIVTDRRIIRLGRDLTSFDLDVGTDGSIGWSRPGRQLSIYFSDRVRIRRSAAQSHRGINLYVCDGSRRIEFRDIRNAARFEEVATREIERHRAGKPELTDAFVAYEQRMHGESRRAQIVFAAIFYLTLALFVIVWAVKRFSPCAGIAPEAAAGLVAMIAAPFAIALVLAVNRRARRRLGLGDRRVFGNDDADEGR